MGACCQAGVDKHARYINHEIESSKEPKEPSYIKSTKLIRIDTSTSIYAKTHKIPDFNFSTPIDEEIHDYSHKYDSFAQGALRRAYAGRINKGPKKGTRIVVKKWKEKHVFDINFWDKEISTHKKAKELIDKWNELERVSKKYVTHVPFKIICVTSNEKVGDREEAGAVVGEYLVGEEYIEGTWQKWNSNSGYVQLESSSVHAFCHWTYHYSQGEFLMCDAQGVRANDAYHITDPCIVSKKALRYGCTDAGQEGIDSFFAHHKCNKFCKPHWRKPSFIDTTKLLPVKKSTTYKWQIGNGKKTGSKKWLSTVKESDSSLLY